MARIGKADPVTQTVIPMPANIPVSYSNKSDLNCENTNPFRNDDTPVVVAMHRKTIQNLNATSERRKISICCTHCDILKCSTCLHVEFLKKPAGLLKILEVILGTISMFLLLEYGATYATRIGGSYTDFLIAVSASLIPTVLLILCYLCSKHSFTLLRASNFETSFNLLACLMYLASSTYLAYGVSTSLYYDYTRIPQFQVYPALCAVYTLGFLLGVIHGADSVLAYKCIN